MSTTDDPVGYFLEDQRYHGKADRTLDAYERVLREFESFLTDPARGPNGAVAPGNADRRSCMAWVHELRARHAESTVASYAAYVHRFYAYMVQIGEFDANPMALVVEEMDETIDKDPTRRELSLSEMQSFVESIGHPLDRAAIVTFLKSGIRVGELCNLDLRDVWLGDGLIESWFDVSPRSQLHGRGPALYVDNSPVGDNRTASNKRKRETIVPIDEELGQALRLWLLIRPDTGEDPSALFVHTKTSWGDRMTPQAVRERVRTHAERVGWYTPGGDPNQNVTPHYFRHFFTTYLRDRTGDRGIVKYLRGDVASDIIDTYTHNWGDRVREVYEANIYSLSV